MGRAADGAQSLDALHAALSRYVAFPSEQAADAATLWTAASHAQPAWEHAPRLAPISAVKRSGKSRLMDVVAETCHRPLITVNCTLAALVRSIDEDDPPTLLVDEADTIFGTKKQADNNEDLRGVLNAGHQRNRPLLRWDMTARRLDELPTFAMAMLASIGDLPDTIMDRAVVIRMRRRMPSEQVSPWRTRRDGPPLNKLRDQLNKWVRANLKQLRTAAPQMTLEDRVADTWEALISIGDLAGGTWPARSRAAAETLIRQEVDAEADASAGIRLLEDIYTVFDDTAALHSKTLLDRLLELGDSPWSDWGRGRGLNQTGLAKLLRPFGIKPRDVRELGTGPNLKGYRVEWFDDAWTRYTPYVRDSRDIRDSAGQSPNSSRDKAATKPRQTDLVADVAASENQAATGLTSHVADVAAVAGIKRERGWTAAEDTAWRTQQQSSRWRCDRCGFQTTHRRVASYQHTNCGGLFKEVEL